MSSTSGGRSLPLINSSDHPRTSDEKTRTQSKEMPGRGYSLQRATNTKAPRARRNLGNNQPSRQVALGESSNEHNFIYNRTGRSSSTSVEDADRLRNWNSEGGKPKRTLSDRSSTRRLLHRSSINSVGGLIPFQRAPRDGSYESHLPVGKKAMPQKLTRQDNKKDVINLEQRRASRLQVSLESNGSQSSNSQAGMASNAPSLSLEGQKRQSGKSKGTNMSSDYRRDGSGVTRKRSTQEGDTSTSIRLSEARPRECALSGVTRQSVTYDEGLVTDTAEPNQSNSSTRTVANVRKNTEMSNNVAATTSVIDGDYDEDGPTLSQNVRVTSPSAEFKVAAQQSTTSSVQPSTSTVSTTSTNAATHHTHLDENLDDVHVINLPSGHEFDSRTPEQLNASQQPNSVVRQRMNSSETVDTCKIRASQVSAPLPVSPSLKQSLRRDHNPSHREEASSGNPTATQSSTLGGPECSSQIGSASLQRPSPRDEVVSVSPRMNVAQPPSSVNTNLATPDSTSTISQQNRLSRFGRRIRMPSSDATLAEQSDQPSQEASQAPEPVNSEEQFEGTHRQRYRFFSLSRDRSESNNAIHIPTLTPNRDLLYGSSSPPLLRRHHRTHFGSGTSNIGHSSEEQGESADIQSSLDSSIGSDNLDLREDSFRTASGSTAIFSPVVRSGPVLDSLSFHQRQRVHGAGFPTHIASNSSIRSSGNNSARGFHHLYYSQRTQPAAEVDMSSDDDHDELTFSVDEGRLSRDARGYQSDRSDAIPHLLSQRRHQPSRELSREAEIMADVFGSAQDHTFQRSLAQSPLGQATLELQVPLLGSPLFAPLGIAPGMLLNLLIRTRREFGQEFMELLLENMMLNVLAHHLFATDQDETEDGINGAPPPATQDVINNLKEIPALEAHIAKEMKCAICHSEYELHEMLAELPCLHFFHPTCVAVWLKKSGTCPVCRFQLSSPTK